MLLEQVVGPVDLVRRSAYRALGPRVGRLLVDREQRVGLIGSAGIFALFVATCTAPALLLGWGPLVLGVPHVAADLRYLVLRRDAPRSAWLAALPALAAMWMWPHAWVGLLAPAGALLLAPGEVGKRALGIALALSLSLLCWQIGPAADLTFAYAHNVVALGLFWAWAPRRGRLHLFLLALVAGFAALLGLGVAADADLSRYLPGPTALVQLFAFTQAVHYLVWLRLIPDEDRPRPTPRSYRGSVRALRRELGTPLLVAFVIAWLGLLIWGAIDADLARLGYLRAVLFHGHLELCAVALLWVSGRRPVASGGRT